MDTTKLPEELRNKIFSWHGGGYDGCIWEPNLAYSDEDGTYHPVISTGFDGIRDADQLLSVVEEQRMHERGEIRHFSREPFRVLDMSQESVDFLCRNVRNDFVAKFVDRLNERGKQGFDMICCNCGERFCSLDYTFSDLVQLAYGAGYYRGDGGIGCIVDGAFCDDCRYELIEKIREGDWIHVFSGARSYGLSNYSYCVKRIDEIGNFVVENDSGEEVTVDSGYCEKSN